MGLIAALLTLLTYWLCHVIWFRAAWPRSPLRALLSLLIVAIMIYGALAWWLSQLPTPPWLTMALGGASFFWLGLLMVVSSVLAYIVVYSGVEVESPSLRIVTFIAESPSGIIPHDKLRALFDNERVIIPRLNDMVRSGLVVVNEGRYQLTPSGQRLATIFRVYRSLIRRDKGG